MMPDVQLFIPQLLQPLREWNKGRNKDFLFEPEAPELCQLLSQFDVSTDESLQGLDASLFAATGMFNSEKQEEGEQIELPVAQYRYLTHDKLPPQKHLICADPIHLEVGMKDITLTHIIDDLSTSDAEEAIKALNKHFKQDNLRFIQGSNQHWYLSLPAQENINTTPLSQVYRKNIAKSQPYSTTRNWNVIQNEAQMILHNCEVNQQREMAGLATLNSLWFWGGGEAPAPSVSALGTAEPTKPMKNIVDIFYNNNAKSSVESTVETTAKTIANATSCNASSLGDTLPEFKVGTTLFILDQLFHPAVLDNLDGYQQALTQIDDGFIKPLTQAWQAGGIEISINCGDGTILKPIKSKPWKFWANKPTKLSSLATQVTR